MANLLQRGTSWLTAKTFDAAGETAVYTRGANSTTLAVATGGAYAFRIDQGDGTTAVAWSDQDFIVKRSDLKINGVNVLPAKGDKITRTVDGRAQVYAMMPIQGEQSWRWHDPNQETMRIHCKLITELTA
jgi:hypothetical protein